MRVVLQYLEPDDEASRLTLRFTLPAKWLAADPAKRTTCRKLLQFFANSYNARLDDGSSARLNVDDYEVFDEDGNALSDLGVADALADGAKLAVRSLRSAAPPAKRPSRRSPIAPIARFPRQTRRWTAAASVLNGAHRDRKRPTLKRPNASRQR